MTLVSQYVHACKLEHGDVLKTPSHKDHGFLQYPKAEGKSLVLIKLKLAVPNVFMASMFHMSNRSCCSTINICVRYLAKKLKAMVYWPDKHIIQTLLSKSVATK